jgi:hypothetical protein
VFTDEAGTFAVLNVNVFDARAEFTSSVEPFSYDGETAEQRRARRLARWTPAGTGSMR